MGRVWQHEKGFGGCWSEETWVERLSAAYESFCASTAFNTLKYTATHCNKLQSTAAHCSTLQHTATYCNALHRTASSAAINMLRHTPTHTKRARLLQYAATHRNTLQHTPGGRCASTCFNCKLLLHTTGTAMPTRKSVPQTSRNHAATPHRRHSPQCTSAPRTIQHTHAALESIVAGVFQKTPFCSRGRRAGGHTS